MIYLHFVCNKIVVWL